MASNPLSYAENLYLNGELMEVLEVPNGVTEIGNYAFVDYDGLTRVILPHGVKKIGVAAFNCCDGLTSINIPDSVESIGNSAFWGCTSLTDIVIPEGVDVISYGVFGECLNLINVTIPRTVKNIYYNAFKNCSNLATVSYGGTADEWQSIDIGSGNSFLINSDILYIPRVETDVSDDGKTFTITPINVENGKAVILALYNGGKFVEMQPATYEGDTLTFTTDKEYINAKVMVWNDLTNLKPICETETVK